MCLLRLTPIEIAIIVVREPNPEANNYDYIKKLTPSAF